MQLIDELNWMIGPDLDVVTEVDQGIERNRRAVRSLQATLAAHEDMSGANALAAALEELGDSDTVLQSFDQALVVTMPARVAALNDALDAQAVR